ncbi:MAG: hypothetical protein ABI624_19705 [Casimicrobiaceae bacterium]
MNSVSKARSPALLRRMDAYWRAANYISVGQTYLRDNPPLTRPLVTCRRTHHDNIHSRDYEEEGAITTPLAMAVTGERGLSLKRQLQEKLLEHRRCINTHGQEMPEVRDWKWRRN